MSESKIVEQALNPQPQPTRAENLKLALGWIEQFHAVDKVSLIALGSKQPHIHFEHFEDYQRFFGGKPARIKKGLSTWDYEVTMDGIKFCCCRWMSLPSSYAHCEEEVPVLDSLPK